MNIYKEITIKSDDRFLFSRFHALRIRLTTGIYLPQFLRLIFLCTVNKLKTISVVMTVILVLENHNDCVLF